MAFNHEAVAANPVGGNPDTAALRSLLERRYVYCLDASENAEDFVAVDPATGVLPLYLIQNNIRYAYDSTDTTTLHDGVTCLVTSDGKRYKAFLSVYPWSVLTYTTSAQPASPSVGDAYLIPGGATGTDWAGKSGFVGIYTPSGWKFAVVAIGRLLYVEDTLGFMHRAADGTWTTGVGDLALGASSIASTVSIGAAATWTRRVENQTTNTPPGSPVVGVSYIIGPAPTGAWAANAAKIAVCDATGVFTIITPADGEVVYDKALLTPYRWSGALSAWITATGRMKCVTTTFTSGGTFSKNSRCVFVETIVIGGGGGASDNAPNGGSAGGTSSFGSLSSAGGGAGGGSAAPAAGGTASGGNELNVIGAYGTVGQYGIAGVVRGTYGQGGYCGATGEIGGGGGGAAISTLLASAIGTNETVTVGAAGAKAAGSAGGAGIQGIVQVREWIEI